MKESNYDIVRADSASRILPTLVNKTLEILQQGHSLPDIPKFGGIQGYCADLAVSYDDALVERLKKG